MDTQQTPVFPATQQTQTTSKSDATNGQHRQEPLMQIANSTSAATNSLETPEDKVLWQSEDGLVVIKQLVRQAQRHPPSNYPCIVIQCFPQPHERVRRIPGGGVEVMPAHVECDAIVDAINAVSMRQGKGKIYDVLQRVPPKPKARKEAWKHINIERAANGRRTFGWRCNRRERR